MAIWGHERRDHRPGRARRVRPVRRLRRRRRASARCATRTRCSTSCGAAARSTSGRTTSEFGRRARHRGRDGRATRRRRTRCCRSTTVQQALKDGETFSSSGYADSMGLVFGHSILEMDEPEHHQYRSLIQQAFTRKAMERWEADLVRPIVNGLVDGFADRGNAELVRELFFPFPVQRDRRDARPAGGAISRRSTRKAVELISIAIDIERGLDRVAVAVRLLRRDHRRAAQGPARRRHQRPRRRPSSTACASPTTRSSPSSGSCSRPVRRRRTGRRAT